MEHGLDSPLSNVQVPNYVKNGVSPIMANFPDGPVSQAKEKAKSNEPVKVNGEGTQGFDDLQGNPYEDSYSSESDALVIDESIPKIKNVRSRYKKKSRDKNITEKDVNEPQSKLDNEDQYSGQHIKSFSTSDSSELIRNQGVSSSEIQNIQINISNENTRTSDNFSVSSDVLNDENNSKTHTQCDDHRASNDISNNPELLSHSNPFFNESLFELSQLHHANNENSCSEIQDGTDNLSSVNKILKRTRSKPKLKEYAQYLGLQPAIRFKCPRCAKSGFESLLTLQEHFLQCNAIHPLEKSSENENVSGFKLTRKVFLCSACGTYYENWNLYMHMLEYHKRYICLYCLGMFSILDDLCQHIQSRHNLEPGIRETLEDFYNTYNEPCYVVCCECNQQFNEGDNFFYHKCIPTKPITKGKSKHIKQVITPENHITGDFGALPSKVTDHPNTKVVTEYSANDDERDEEDATSNLDKLPVQEYLPEHNCVNNQGNNVKHTGDIESTKNSDSDSTESDDFDCPDKGIDCKDSKDTNDTEELKSNQCLEQEINDNRTQEIDEQDSLDSSKISEENTEHQQHSEYIMDNMEEHFSDSGDNGKAQEVKLIEPVETRKVPKLSLKLPKLGSYLETEPEDSDESDKLDMEVDNIESENDNDNVCEEGKEPEQTTEQLENTPEELISEENQNRSISPQYPLAGPDIPVIEIELDQPLDRMDIRILLQKCLRATVPSCIYCNHSRRIAVNGKQLGLHAIAEHRYSAINKSITEEELIPESFNLRIKECLEQLETIFFNLDSSASDEAVTFSHVFECFQCHYSTTVHKELYLHNRKFHSNNLLLCIMCKSNFYSYSELICHLCPGSYVLDYDVHFRCCMCVSDDLPSSFRLMVHLRKRHNVCDVCLEMCHSQYKLSNHVWKHKLHHFCYRCGIAYRNKPDITRHLFWKHGTESVLCKKCLQKKWPHVYHFCVPPSNFVCEECNLAFTKAVSLKVHKRLHTDEKKHACTWDSCMEAFISKKLLLKHVRRHTDPPEEINIEEEVKDEVEAIDDNGGDINKNKDEEITEIEEPPKPKPKVDVYDLPALNLSESDSSDSENEHEKPTIEDSSNRDLLSEDPDKSIAETFSPIDESALGSQAGSAEDAPLPNIPEHSTDDTSSAVMQDIWDNFKNYQANKEKMDNMLIGDIDTKVDQPYIPDIPIPEVEEGISWQLALRDHDYYIDPEKVQAPDAIIEVKPSLESTESMDHDYCFQTEKNKANTVNPVIAVPPPPEPLTRDKQKSSSSGRKRTNASSSSGSDSDSSCACGSSCSCSDSSSGSSSSSSDSSNSDSSTEEGRKKQQQRRLKRKERSKASKKTQSKQALQEKKAEVVASDQPVAVMDMPIRESDLETTESETDEEFYDREPQKFARKILEEKRAQLLAEMGPNMVPNGSFIESTSRPPTPPAGTIEEEEQPKRKKKAKKRKKRKSEKKMPVEERTYSATLILDPQPVAPPPSVPYYQQFHQTGNQSPTVAPITLSLTRHSPITAPQTPPLFPPGADTPALARQESTASDTSIRASKRRRVPNKFYGYSSDEEADKPQSLKRSKIEINRTIPAPSSPMLVPPITIKTVASPLVASPRPPTVEPITLRLPKLHNPSSDYKSHRRPPIPPIRLSTPRSTVPLSRDDSATESNDSDIDELPSRPPPQIMAETPKPPQPQLYCYCRCPYDEVSEMIGCDSNDCQIEWFHFECVGIMVPPKGQWFCPDCRKKKQQRSLL